MEEKTLDIREIFYAIKKRYKLILIIILLPVLLSVYKASQMRVSYEARIRLFVGKEGIKGSYSANELEDYKSMIGAYIDIFNNEDIIAEVLEEAKIDLPVNYVRGGLSFSPGGGSIPTLDVRYRSYNKDEAEKIVTVITDGFRKKVGEYIVNSNIDVFDSVKVNGIYPNKKRVVMVGFILGFIVALGVVFVLDYLDNSIKNKDELEKILPIPVIGEIPIHD